MAVPLLQAQNAVGATVFEAMPGPLLPRAAAAPRRAAYWRGWTGPEGGVRGG